MAILYSVQEKELVISSFIVNITNYCLFRGRVAGHIRFAALGSHTRKRLGTAALGQSTFMAK